MNRGLVWPDMTCEAGRIITKLGLERLPGEGGYFRRTWTGPTLEGSDRPAGTAISFLITPEEFSAWHRLQTDEIWHFQAGDPVKLMQLDESTGELRTVQLGPDILAGEEPQVVVPSGVWQGACLATIDRGWALLGCTLVPGWDEREFQLADPEELRRKFPGARAEIGELIR